MGRQDLNNPVAQLTVFDSARVYVNLQNLLSEFENTFTKYSRIGPFVNDFWPIELIEVKGKAARPFFYVHNIQNTPNRYAGKREALLGLLSEGELVLEYFKVKAITINANKYLAMAGFLMDYALILQELIDIYGGCLSPNLLDHINSLIRSIAEYTRFYSDILPQNRLGYAKVKLLMERSLKDKNSGLALPVKSEGFDHFMPYSQSARFVSLVEQYTKLQEESKRKKGIQRLELVLVAHALKEKMPDNSNDEISKSKAQILNLGYRRYRDPALVYVTQNYIVFLQDLIKLCLQYIPSELQQTHSWRKFIANFSTLSEGLVPIEVFRLYRNIVLICKNISDYNVIEDLNKLFWEITKLMHLGYGVNLIDALQFYSKLRSTLRSDSLNINFDFSARVQQIRSTFDQAKKSQNALLVAEVRNRYVVPPAGWGMDDKKIESINTMLRVKEMLRKLGERFFGKKYARWRKELVIGILAISLAVKYAPNFIAQLVIRLAEVEPKNVRGDNEEFRATQKGIFHEPPSITTPLGFGEKQPPDNAGIESKPDKTMGIIVENGSVEGVGQKRALSELTEERFNEFLQTEKKPILYSPLSDGSDTTTFKIPVEWEVIGFYSNNENRQAMVNLEVTMSYEPAKGIVEFFLPSGLKISDFFVVAKEREKAIEWKNTGIPKDPYTLEILQVEKIKGLIAGLETINSDESKEMASILNGLLTEIESLQEEEPEIKRAKSSEYIRKFIKLYQGYVSKNFYYSLEFNPYNTDIEDENFLLLQIVRDISNHSYKGHICLIAERAFTEILKAFGIKHESITIDYLYKRDLTAFTFVGHTFNLLVLPDGSVMVVDTTPEIKEGKSPADTLTRFNTNNHNIEQVYPSTILLLIEKIGEIIKSVESVNPLLIASLVIGVFFARKLIKSVGGYKILEGDELQIASKAAETVRDYASNKFTDNQLAASDFLIAWILSFTPSDIAELTTLREKILTIYNRLIKFEFTHLKTAADIIGTTPVQTGPYAGNITFEQFNDLINKEDRETLELTPYFNSLSTEDKRRFIHTAQLVNSMSSDQLVNSIKSRLEFPDSQNVEADQLEGLRSEIFWDLLFPATN